MRPVIMISLSTIGAVGLLSLAVSAQAPPGNRAAELQKWPVHDEARPMPPVVDPGPAGPPAAVPADAVVLFDGKDLSGWTTAKGAPARWLVKDGYMEVVKGAGSIQTVRASATASSTSSGPRPRLRSARARTEGTAACSS